jgi:hypothetical protein
MSTKTKFYKMLTGLMLLSTVTFAQLNYPHKLLELTTGSLQGGGVVTGSGFGPRIANHVVTFDRDSINNNNFVLQTQGTNPVNPPMTATFKLENQQYTGLTYGIGTLNGGGTSNAITTGLVFGAGPSLASGAAPGTPDVQQATPLNSYNILGAFNGGGGPRDGMFKSDCSNPAVAAFPGGSGTGIDAKGDFPDGIIANDANGGVQLFTCAQKMYDLNNPGGTANRYYYGDLVIAFNKFVDSVVVHIAGLGGSYRYTVAGGNSAILADWRSTFFSTELELVPPPNVSATMAKMAGNQFLSVSGLNILNNAVTPNGESFDVGAVSLPNWNNFGAATGSVRINFTRSGGVPTTANFLRFKIWLRGSDSNSPGIKWSAPFTAVSGGVRDPLTGDIWAVSVSAKSANSIPACAPPCGILPATGVRLTAALNGNDVGLSWVTETEINTDHFEIERSTDNISFSRIANKASAGNSASTVNYAYTDPSMAAAVYYYRLKLVDMNGQYVYSNTALVRKPNGVKGVRVFPNPVTDMVNLEFVNAKGNFDITFYNQSGQKVMNRTANIGSTVQYVNISKGTLAPGSYLISARNTETNEKFVQNVIIQ